MTNQNLIKFESSVILKILLLGVCLLLVAPVSAGFTTNWTHNQTSAWVSDYQNVNANATTICTAWGYPRTCEGVNGTESCWAAHNTILGTNAYKTFNEQMMEAWMNAHPNGTVYDNYIGCFNGMKIPGTLFWNTTAGGTITKVGKDTSVLPPVCSFTAVPASGSSPLSVSFTDTSTSAAMRSWEIYDNSTGLPVLTSALQTWSSFLTGTNTYYDVKLAAGNTAGNCSVFSPKYIVIGVPGVYLNVVDVTTGTKISGANVGIYNGTDNSWYNTTAATGGQVFTGTGALQKYILSYGQQLLLAASANGYRSASLDASEVGYYNFIFTVNNEIVTINLVPTVTVPKTGTANLIVSVTKNNADHADPLTGSLALPGASVYIGEGSNWSVKTTGSSGVVTFYNRTPVSTHISVSEPWYESQEKYVTLAAGSTQTVNFSMVMRGETPVTVTAVATVPTGAGGGGTSGTGTGGVPVVTPTLTDKESQLAMVHTLYENGPLIVELCVFVTIFALLGVKLGK